MNLSPSPYVRCTQLAKQLFDPELGEPKLTFATDPPEADHWMKRAPERATMIATVSAGHEARIARVEYSPGTHTAHDGSTQVDHHNVAKGEACTILCAELAAELQGHTSKGAA